MNKCTHTHTYKKAITTKSNTHPEMKVATTKWGFVEYQNGTWEWVGETWEWSHRGPWRRCYHLSQIPIRGCRIAGRVRPSGLWSPSPPCFPGMPATPSCRSEQLLQVLMLPWILERERERERERVRVCIWFSELSLICWLST